MNKVINKENFFEKLKHFPVRNTFIWNLLNPIVTFFCKVKEAKDHFDKIELDKLILDNSRIDLFITDLTVKNGPFKGLVYDCMESAGSAIYPKLIGSYESELHTQIETLISQKNYTNVIDIGCAEGYYAVGFAKILPYASVYAYDIDKKARELCHRMALINGVGQRLFIKNKISKEDLLNFNLDDSTLIICDCEGFEKELFTLDLAKKLHRCDFIIEMHDNIDINISSELVSIFKKTHEIKLIKSIDDLQKAKTYDFLPDEISLQAKRILYSERPFIMEWLICISNYN